MALRLGSDSQTTCVQDKYQLREHRESITIKPTYAPISLLANELVFERSIGRKRDGDLPIRVIGRREGDLNNDHHNLVDSHGGEK